jgi:perosamine synthetase
VGLTPQIEDVGTKSICWMTSYTLDPALPISRDELIKTLKSFGVDSRPVFPSISRYEIWGYQPSTPLNSEFIGENGINLPSGVMLNRATVDRVCHLIREAIGC